MDRPIDLRNQGAVHRKLHAVHGHGSQWEKDSGRDPMVDIHHDPDLMVHVCCRFIRRGFVRSDGPEVIYHAIGRLRTFPTLNRRSFAWSDGQNFIRIQIGWLTFDPTLIRIKILIFLADLGSSSLIQWPKIFLGD